MLASPSRTPEKAALPAPAADSAPKITRGHSCVLCQQRKVKCDKQKPCSNCVKARTNCVVATPSQPRRRRKRLTESDLVMRLRRYEHLLKSHGVKVEEEDLNPQDFLPPSKGVDEIDINNFKRLTFNVPPSSYDEPGSLFFGKTHAQYVENSMWAAVKDEIQEQLETSSEEDADETDDFPPGEAVLMPSISRAVTLTSSHPTIAHVFQLWQIFLNNVNPIIKLFHAPTVQQMIITASRDMESLSKSNEALMFSIYFLAILSLTTEDCIAYFGDTQKKLLVKYTRAVQQALVNAKLLRTMNLTTLQSFILYLIGARRLYDAHTIWALTGVALRVGHRLGLHIEGGGPTPFDAEMRRRTWWQLVFLDGHASKVAGAPPPISTLSKFSTKFPVSVGDSELSPDMQELPKSKEGITEMSFCAMRYETVQLLRKTLTFPSASEDGSPKSCTIAEFIASKDKAINELEQLFDQKYLRHCDPSVPFQTMMMNMGKSIISSLKITAHHPRNYPDMGASMPQWEKDMLFNESLTELETFSQSYETKCIQGFMWHIYAYFQLDGFIYIISELRVRTTGEIVERAWEQVRLAYLRRPDLISDTRNILFVAIGSLVLKAWAKREEAINGYNIAPPHFISQIRAQKSAPRSKSHTQSPPQDELSQILTTSEPVMQFTTYPPPPAVVGMPDQMNLWAGQSMNSGMGMNDDLPMPGFTSMDWEYWQTLMDGELPTYVPYPNNQDWM